MVSVRLACEAMATRFEFVLLGPNAVALRSAGEEAVGEIHRLEALLSLYRSDSAVAAVNRDAARHPVRVPPEVFRLLEHALVLSRATDGAFDVTVGPLLRIWGLMRGTGRVPTDDEIADARASVGADRVELDPDSFAVRFDRPGVMVDLGSIGKGYALDRAAELLREAGVEHALIHGGTSTAIAWGRPGVGMDATSAAPGTGNGEAWRIAIEPPARASEALPSPTPGAPLAVVELRDESLSVSAVWGKGFTAAGHYFGHVMDPRCGRPVQGASLAAMVLPSATESDALSTALLVRGSEMVERLRTAGAPARCLVVERPTAMSEDRVIAYRLEARIR